MREEKGEETLKPLLTACRQDRKAQEGGGGVGDKKLKWTNTKHATDGEDEIEPLGCHSF